MRRSRSLAFLFTLALSLSSTAAVPDPLPAAVPNSATQALLVEKPNLQGMVSDNRLIAFYGEPIATGEAATPRDFADAFLADRGDALGVTGAVFQYQGEIDIRNGKFRVFTYTQTIEGLPVEYSVVKFPILMPQGGGTDYKIPYVGMHLVSKPTTPLPGDQIDAPRRSTWWRHYRRTLI